MNITIDTNKYEFIILIPKYAYHVDELKNKDLAQVNPRAKVAVRQEWQEEIEIWRNGTKMSPLSNFEMKVNPLESDYVQWKENEIIKPSEEEGSRLPF